MTKQSQWQLRLFKAVNYIMLAVIILAVAGAAFPARALEIGETEKDAYGMEGLELTRIPLPERGWWPDGLEYHDFTYKNGALKIEGTIVKPRGDGPFPGIVLNHGGGSSAKVFGMEYGWQCGVRGFVAIACDLTHSKRERSQSGGRGGNAANPRENIDRDNACMDILEKLPYVDSNKLAMFGTSMGGFQTMAMAGESTRLKAAVVIAGGLRGGPNREAPAEVKANCPILILHGTDDQTVDVSSDIAYYNALREAGKPVEIYLFDGVGHTLLNLRTAEVCDLIADFLNRSFENSRQDNAKSE